MNAIDMIEHSRYHQYDWELGPGRTLKAHCSFIGCNKPLEFRDYWFHCMDHGQVKSPNWLNFPARPPCPWCPKEGLG